MDMTLIEEDLRTQIQNGDPAAGETLLSLANTIIASADSMLASTSKKRALGRKDAQAAHRLLEKALLLVTSKFAASLVRHHAQGAQVERMRLSTLSHAYAVLGKLHERLGNTHIALRYLDSAIDHARRGGSPTAQLHVSASAVASGLALHKDGLAHATAALAELATRYESAGGEQRQAGDANAPDALPPRSAREWLTYSAALYNAAVQCEHLRQAHIAIELYRRGAGSVRELIEELRTGVDAGGAASELDTGGFSSADADAAMRLITQAESAAAQLETPAVEPQLEDLLAQQAGPAPGSAAANAAGADLRHAPLTPPAEGREGEEDYDDGEGGGSGSGDADEVYSPDKDHEPAGTGATPGAPPRTPAHRDAAAPSRRRSSAPALADVTVAELVGEALGAAENEGGGGAAAAASGLDVEEGGGAPEGSDHASRAADGGGGGASKAAADDSAPATIEAPALRASSLAASAPPPPSSAAGASDATPARAASAAAHPSTPAPGAAERRASAGAGSRAAAASAAAVAAPPPESVSRAGRSSAVSTAAAAAAAADAAGAPPSTAGSASGRPTSAGGSRGRASAAVARPGSAQQAAGTGATAAHSVGRQSQQAGDGGRRRSDAASSDPPRRPGSVAAPRRRSSVTVYAPGDPAGTGRGVAVVSPSQQQEGGGGARSASAQRAFEAAAARNPVVEPASKPHHGARPSSGSRSRPRRPSLLAAAQSTELLPPDDEGAGAHATPGTAPLASRPEWVAATERSPRPRLTRGRHGTTVAAAAPPEPSPDNRVFRRAVPDVPKLTGVPSASDDLVTSGFERLYAVAAEGAAVTSPRSGLRRPGRLAGSSLPAGLQPDGSPQAARYHGKVPKYGLRGSLDAAERVRQRYSRAIQNWQAQRGVTGQSSAKLRHTFMDETIADAEGRNSRETRRLSSSAGLAAALQREAAIAANRGVAIDAAAQQAAAAAAAARASAPPMPTLAVGTFGAPHGPPPSPRLPIDEMTARRRAVAHRNHAFPRPPESSSSSQHILYARRGVGQLGRSAQRPSAGDAALLGYDDAEWARQLEWALSITEAHQRRLAYRAAVVAQAVGAGEGEDDEEGGGDEAPGADYEDGGGEDGGGYAAAVGAEWPPAEGEAGEADEGEGYGSDFVASSDDGRREGAEWGGALPQQPHYEGLEDGEGERASAVPEEEAGGSDGLRSAAPPASAAGGAASAARALSQQQQPQQPLSRADTSASAANARPLPTATTIAPPPSSLEPAPPRSAPSARADAAPNRRRATVSRPDSASARPDTGMVPGTPAAETQK